MFLFNFIKISPFIYVKKYFHTIYKFIVRKIKVNILIKKNSKLINAKIINFY